MKTSFAILCLILSAMINAQNETETTNHEEVFTIVDEMPSFPGGEMQLIKFFRTNLKYPLREKAAHISGCCFITFVVEKDGSIQNIKILEGVTGGAGCDQEVIRVANLMPVWNPGKHHGKTVRTQFNLPVKFILY